MIDILDFYILGKDIQTEIGNCSFLKVKEYPDYYNELIWISKDSVSLAYKFQKEYKISDEDCEIIKNTPLIELVRTYEFLMSAYFKVFIRVFNDKDILKKINAENFNNIRSLILKMNAIKEDKSNPNPEIQACLERSKRVKAQNAPNITFSDIVITVSNHKKVSYEVLNEQTLYQLYCDFASIGNNISYETSTLFATVSSEVKRPNWCEHIDITQEETEGLQRSEYEKLKNNIFK